MISSAWLDICSGSLSSAYLNLQWALDIVQIQRSGCNGSGCHAQMYTMGTLLRCGSDEQKNKFLPSIANGSLRLQAFGVTEPTSGTGSLLSLFWFSLWFLFYLSLKQVNLLFFFVLWTPDTLSLRTTAQRKTVDGKEVYVVRGQKVWTSRAEYSDLMLLLARTSGKGEAADRTFGLSVFLLDMREAKQVTQRRGRRGKRIEFTNPGSFFIIFYFWLNRKGSRSDPSGLWSTTRQRKSSLMMWLFPRRTWSGRREWDSSTSSRGWTRREFWLRQNALGMPSSFSTGRVHTPRRGWFLGGRLARTKASSFPWPKAISFLLLLSSLSLFLSGQVSLSCLISFCTAYAAVEAANLMVQKAASLYDEGKKCGDESNMAKYLGKSHV